MEYKLVNISTAEEDFEVRITKELNEFASDGWRVIHGYSLAIGVYLLERETPPKILAVEMTDADFGTRVPVFI